MLSKNIDRIQAEEGQRQLMVLAAAQSEEGYDGFVEQSKKTMGIVIQFDEEDVGRAAMARAAQEYDRAGLLELKGLGNLG